MALTAEEKQILAKLEPEFLRKLEEREQPTPYKTMKATTLSAAHLLATLVPQFTAGQDNKARRAIVRELAGRFTSENPNIDMYGYDLYSHTCHILATQYGLNDYEKT